MQQPSFEAAYTELMETVTQLEHGGLTLEQSLERFERGVELFKVCDQLLDNAEQRVSRLVEEASLEESE